MTDPTSGGTDPSQTPVLQPRDHGTIRQPHRPLLLALLAIFYVLLELTVLGALFDRPGEPAHFMRVWTVLVILMWNQTLLLAGWLAWGDGSTLMRLLLLLTAAFLSHGLVLLTGSFSIAEPLAISMGQSLLTVCPLLVVRSFGWSCRTEQSAAGRAWQFSLAQIIGLTAIVAIAVRLLILVPWQSIDWQEAAALTISTAAIAWILWPTMLTLPPWVAYLAAALGGLAASATVHRWTHTAEAELLLVFELHALLLAGCLHVFRAAGYRLKRPT